MIAPGRAFFVTGTDTGVGKTYACTAFLARARREGLSCAGLKPVASGCVATVHGLRNDDALRLARAGTVALPYAVTNPWAFEPAIAPHIAAARVRTAIGVAPVSAALARARAAADLVVVEGVGGWLVPLSDDTTVADLAVHLALPVVLVVGLRLGCMSHSLLTVESVRGRGLRLAGWVASVLDPGMPALEENLRALARRLDAPLLGCLPYAPRATPEDAALSLRLPN
jgi:dethiobiotin synthetase